MTTIDPITGPVPGLSGAAGAAGVPSPLRQWRRATLSALGDDPRRRPPVVDGYEVGRLLGSGGSSVVWAGTGVDGVERALKVLAPDATTDLLAELSMLRRVRHPRVVAVHDISRDTSGDPDGRPVLVLDLAAGGSLAGLLAQRRRLSAGEVSGLLAVLGPALEDLHAAGVVHGDIAPGNVLLDARGEPLLADLGVARALGRSHGSVLGTPGFADPAALAGAGVSAASDVYGLAALAWYALTGAPPTAAGVLGARVEHRRAVSDLSAGNGAPVLTALREGLHRRPSRRPTPGELAAAVGAAARPRPVRGLHLPAGRPSPHGSPAAEVPPPPGATRQLSAAATTAATTGSRQGAQEVAVAPPPASARASAPAERSRRRPAGARGPVRPTPAPRRLPRLLLAVGALPVLAAVAVVLALRAAGDPAPAPAQAAPVAAPVAAPAPEGTGEPAPAEPAPAEPAGAQVLRGEDPLAVVTELADRRARALSAGQGGALDLVDVAGSAARAADEAVLADLAAAGSSFEALAFHVGAVRELERTDSDGGRWVLEADVVTAEHVVVSAAGTRTTVPAGEPRTSRLTLQRVAGEWRISAVG
ncbi:protein kinase domain-containing protein [Kineococcus sp. SYSU DK003]|uniref:protein kinase domain-containing protein n=1 Tax=Kineococcus sp. SYSU DK003 TaxID=3383124 RepID=UPI003D7E75D4